MALVDLPVLAALLMAVAALPAGWRGGRVMRWVTGGAALLFAVNIFLAWHLDDVPGATAEGQSAAVGILISLFLFLLASVFAVAGRIIGWAMTSQTVFFRKAEGLRR